MLACCLSARAQTDLPKHVVQLARIKRNIEHELAALPNYTCVETIGRWRREDPNRPFRFVDTVRLEVEVVKNRELYSWPGANAFNEQTIREVKGGIISTGSFAIAAQTVFVNNTSTIIWRGEEESRGRHALRWDYTIPYNLSGWTVQFRGRAERVGETGSFWVDAGSLDLLRLEAHAAEIPPGLGVTAVEDTLDYARIRIGSQDPLLPQSVQSGLVETGGQQSRNVIEFSHCRQFAAETSVTFGGAPAIGKAESPPAEIFIPAGLRFAVRLNRTVDSRSAAVGEELSARVESPVEFKKAILVPRDAVLRGRIRRFERYSAPRAHFIVGLEFTDVDFPGHHARFFGEMASIDPVPGIEQLLTVSRSQHLDLMYGGRIDNSETETYSTVPIPGVSTFFVDGARFQLPENLHMVWRTIKLAK